MKIQAGGGVQSLLVAEQSVSSTSDLPSPLGEPFFRLTGTNHPMWLPLICASDTLFLYDLKLACFIFFAQSNQQSLGTRIFFLIPHPPSTNTTPTTAAPWEKGSEVERNHT